MKKKINFIVFITTFLVVLLLSITVYTETGLSSTPSPSSASSPIQSKYSESSSIQLKDLIAPILTALGIAVTYQNGFNPRATLKLDLELREKLLLGKHPVSNIENIDIERKIRHHYKHIYYRKEWGEQLKSGLIYLFFAFIILFFTPSNLMNISFFKILSYIGFSVFLIYGLRLLLKSFWRYREKKEEEKEKERKDR
ncbi:hypothetical protein H6G91_39065 [Nostoc muscorum FACHB-395]|nr:hypothetical protein [Desmonostoc muscorum FACHB-395]